MQNTNNNELRWLATDLNLKLLYTACPIAHASCRRVLEAEDKAFYFLQICKQILRRSQFKDNIVSSKPIKFYLLASNTNINIDRK